MSFCTTILIKWHDKQPQVLCLFIINNFNDIIYKVEQICHQPDRFLFGLYMYLIDRPEAATTECLPPKINVKSYFSHVTLTQWLLIILEQGILKIRE